jgi:hypothetical protein
MATATTEDIERIVREVMAQLGADSKTAGASPSAAPSDAAPAVPLAAHNGDLFVDSRVVTLEAIAGRLGGAKQLTVPPGALVTPSVRDELRRKGVALVRGSAAGARSGLPRVLLVVGPAPHDPAAAAQVVAQDGLDVQTETSDCIIASTDKLAAAVARGQSLGLLWTRHTAAGLCLANRHAGVRAVLAGSVSATAAAISAVGANVLVIDPSVGTAYEKKQIVRDFCLGGIRPCPEALKERSGGRT